MPIPIQCQCGYKSTAPDAAAGKTGKCPKCQASIKVPSGQVDATVGTTSKPSGTPKPTAAASNSGLDKLFADAGIGQSRGMRCPSCDKPLQPGVAVCIECGFHLARGEKLAGVVSQKLEENFEDERLHQASISLKRDAETEARLRFVGAPWWVTLAILLGLIIVILAGVSKVSATASDDYAPEGTVIYAMQKMPVVTLLPFVGILVSGMVFFMSYLAMLVAAFKTSVGNGLLTFFIPFYSHFFAFTNRKRIGSGATIHLIWTVLLFVFLGWFLANRGYKWF